MDTRLIGIEVDDLKNIIQEVIDENLNSSPPDNQPQNEQPDELLNIKDAAKVLNVSVPTMFNYKRKGIIPFYRIGRRVFFKRPELINSLKRINKTEV